MLCDVISQVRTLHVSRMVNRAVVSRFRNVRVIINAYEDTIPINSEGEEEDWGEYSPIAWISFYILFDKLEKVVGAGEWQWRSKTWL